MKSLDAAGGGPEDLAAAARDDAGSRQVTREIRHLAMRLAEGEPDVRELAAAHLGDLLIGACKTGRDTSSIVLPLAEALVRENDPLVQEEIAHSLGHFVEYGTVPQALVEPLQECLPRLSPEAAAYVADLLEAARWDV
ncbi:hypothetical protein [Actinomadura sp. NPDC000600]|uniref:hypothetical protein n=1 Tax=Actinomadura sp. NPDC000600 TaxID=3154262 RepID=UPI00339AF02A